MELVFNKDLGLRLDDVENFKSFKFILEGFHVGEQPEITDFQYENADHVWILPEQVKRFSSSEQWLSDFNQMLQGAKKYGWIHPETNAIKAHIEWLPATSFSDIQPTVLVRKESNYTVITLNRPEKLNAFNEPMLQALQDAIFTATADRSCRAILLTGAGRGFCAGQDLNERKDQENSADLGDSLMNHYNPVIMAIHQAAKPIVCAVNGVAAGAGVSLALACDLVMAEENARFILSFSKIGLAPDAGISWHLPRLIGTARAKALTILAEPVQAQQAKEWGMIWQTLPKDQLLPEAEQLVKQLASRPTQSFAAIKQTFTHSATNHLEQQLLLEATLQRQAGFSADYKRGIAAFFDGTTAQFSGD
ncbi:hypothetical protein F4V57_04715 [Acinetobacter qingfengensis]|uniref:Enoyl-CoA hydratase n=1 Tax=Acinetobacter qingfengensis TaxID=1262585 RepID=A0A1E7RCP4_9GAMM|nr:enoyl-CoA hydratase-related protein [Acinetobacter qingfengensis]KAA8735060.1 hypothetical protein F4V57_04715 [Acinetobacter qingfengensis]OEY97022.1 hypothetical protein BJI46_11310 [Acinetobacter qingfengensis]